MSRGDFHVVWEIAQMFYGHGDYLVRFVTIGDEFNGLSLGLRVLDELFESSSLDEEFNGILQVDAVISDVTVPLVEPTIFCFVNPLPLLRRGLWWLDASFC